MLGQAVNAWAILRPRSVALERKLRARQASSRDLSNRSFRLPLPLASSAGRQWVLASSARHAPSRATDRRSTEVPGAG